MIIANTFVVIIIHYCAATECANDAFMFTHGNMHNHDELSQSGGRVACLMHTIHVVHPEVVVCLISVHIKRYRLTSIDVC